MKKIFFSILACTIFTLHAIANIPGGGSAGANVTVTDNGSTVVLNNGIVSVTITKSSANITNLTYASNNLLSGGYNGGQIYWSWNMPNYQNPSGCTYTLTANPANNNGDYAEVQLHMVWNGSASTAAMDVDVFYSLPRGASGIYASAMLAHPANYPANPGGEWRMASYPGSTFDWMSVDSLRNRKMASLSDWSNAVTVSGAPAEVKRLTTGIYNNQYECKYDYSADIGDINVWGWSSTTKNIGLWVTAPSKEYYNGGPMKRELMCHNSPTMLNMLNGEHYGMGNDLDMVAGEAWKKVYGPFLIYCNSVPAGTPNAPNALFNDAKAQALIEQAAWPYSWFTNENYIKEIGRGTVTGKLVINDVANPTASAANTWVGIAIPPQSGNGITDFQLWAKNYQFWVKTDVNGNFTIPHVLPGTYSLFAFGPGAAGQLTKTSFATVTASTTTALGNVMWVPTRTAPTIWEIGVPDRNAAEFKHGSDYWTSNTYPNTNWGKFMDYTTDFPNDVTYTIGQSNWATNWNFVQPYDNTVQAATPDWKVKFNLTTNPTAGSTAAIYTAFAAAFGSALIVKVNGTNITSPTTGIYPPNASDAKVRKAIHGAFGDYRFTFASSLLHAGANEISFTIRITGGGSVGEVMYDYLRLEATGTSLATVVPVTLQPLSVQKQGKAALLKWSTLTEQNSKEFQLQKSSNGIDFLDLATVAARGNTTNIANYNFIDNASFKKWNYYRLKVVDKDGKFIWSNMVKLNFEDLAANFSIYPNPSKNIITITYLSTQKRIAACSITDAHGKLVNSFFMNLNAGTNSMETNIAHLSAGNYFLKISNADNSIFNMPFVKL